MRKFYFLLLTASGLCAQIPSIDWDKTLGGAFGDQIMVLKELSDGSFIAAGQSDSEISGDKIESCRGYRDFWVIRTNELGYPIWQKTIGGAANETVRTIELALDGGFFIGGESWSGISGEKTEACHGEDDIWIVKLDGFGNILWEKTMGGNDRDEFPNLLPLADGGLVVAASSNSGISGNKTEALRGVTDYWIFRLDATGDFVWEKTIGGGGSDFATRISLLPDGNFEISGTSMSGITGDRTIAQTGGGDNWIVELSASGQLVSQQVLPVNFDLSAQLTDGDFISCGIKQFGPETTAEMIWKRDPDGNLVWQYQGAITIGVTRANYPVAAADGGFYYIQEHPTIGNTLIKRNAGGTIEWQRLMDMGPGEVRQLFKHSDGSLMLAANSSADITSDKSEQSRGQGDYWIVKFNPEQLLVSDPVATTFSAYPNPVIDSLTVNAVPGAQLSLYDTSGRRLLSQFAESSRTGIDFPYIPGTYFITITNPDSQLSTTIKIIK